MAIREIIDRAEGKATSTVNVNTEPTPNVEAYRRAIMSHAKAIVDEYGISEEEALKGMAEARPEIKQYLQ